MSDRQLFVLKSREAAKVVYRAPPEIAHGPMNLAPGGVFADVRRRKPHWQLWKKMDGAQA